MKSLIIGGLLFWAACGSAYSQFQIWDCVDKKGKKSTSTVNVSDSDYKCKLSKKSQEALRAAKKQGVLIGMSKEEVLASSWGKPKSINTTTTARGTREQWVYGGRNYLYFKDGVLATIQN